MKDENKLLINDEQQSNRDDSKQSVTNSEESRYRIDNVARRFKFQCRLVLMLFVSATVVSICLAVTIILVIPHKNEDITGLNA
jgi:hypothetical protein